MAFLGGLFKRKPGGTLIGNLFRKVANAATGGILGNGAGMITQEEADARDLNDYDFFAKYGYNKPGAVNPVNQGQTGPTYTPVYNGTGNTGVNNQTNNNGAQNSPGAGEAGKGLNLNEITDPKTTTGKIGLGILGLIILYFANKKFRWF